MKVIVADSLGMCFGVRDAVELALRSPHRTDLTVLGELVHNPDVLERLSSAGVRTAPSPEAPVETSHVMITAHGAAPSVVRRLEERGLAVAQATCPLVAHAHRMLDRLIAAGYFPVIVGRADHVEVRGLTTDLSEFEVIEAPSDIRRLAGRPRLGVVSQTTQPLDYVLGIVDEIRRAFPDAEVRWADTVCQPTKERQLAARRLATACPVVVVVGWHRWRTPKACVRNGSKASGRWASPPAPPPRTKPSRRCGLLWRGSTAEVQPARAEPRRRRRGVLPDEGLMGVHTSSVPQCLCGGDPR
jgi:4-hydroxy-3-methylbut-2-en-1-yl diphosphate reductase